MFTYESEEPDLFYEDGEYYPSTDPNTLMLLYLIILFFGWAATKDKKE